MFKREEDTGAQTPKSKMRLSLHHIVSMLDILEFFATQLNEIRRQVIHLLVKYDNVDPAVYNKMAEDLRDKGDGLLSSFKNTLEDEENERPSQSIIVNVNDQKRESNTPAALKSKMISLVSVAIAIAASILFTLREVGVIK